MVRLTIVSVWAVGVLLVTAGPAASQVRAFEPNGSTRLLDVPYLSQTEDLCGGAAMAMVQRYWGAAQARPEDYATLIDRSAAGIRTDVLTADVIRRGWQAFPVDAAAGAIDDWMRDQIERGRPVVALIEVRPGRYHYIVVVGWTPAQVIAHDPADAPFGVLTRADFDRAWAAAGRWALLVLPSADLSTSAPQHPSTSAPQHPSTSAPQHSSTSAPPSLSLSSPCAPLIARMVTLAGDGKIAEADSGLVVATELCPDDPSAWRELAGIRFLQSNWGEAAALAEYAATLEPDDAAGWDLLATSRFLNDEPEAALGAWNRIARPAVDVVRVEGAHRTRHPVVVDLLNLPPSTQLTPDNLAHAARRLAELPSSAQTTLRYRPLPGGTVEVDAVVVERPTLPSGLLPIASTLVRGWLQDELRVDAASLTKGGELLTVAWRWWETRPRIAMSLAVPAVSWLPGVTTVEGSWERQTYGAPAGDREEWRHAGLRVADWASRSVRWNLGTGFDRWADDSHLSVGGGVDWRLAEDRAAVGVAAAAFTPLGSGNRFTTGQVSTAWRSTTNRDRTSWSGLVAYTAASAAAPYDLWPGAGTGRGRAPLLRAHPLLNDGVVTGEAFGRQLIHGTIEYQHPLLASAMGSLRLAAFADTARAWHRLAGDRSLPHLDLGVGLRVAVPGNRGAMRLDVARGMQDGTVVVSAGWQPPWTGQHDY